MLKLFFYGLKEIGIKTESESGDKNRTKRKRSSTGGIDTIAKKPKIADEKKGVNIKSEMSVVYVSKWKFIHILFFTFLFNLIH